MVAESPLSSEDVLEVLRGSLDPQAFEIAAGALSAELERREQDRSIEDRYTLVAGMVAGYERILKSDLAHTQGALAYSCRSYLKTPSVDNFPEDIDKQARLYAAYFMASEPYDFEETYEELLNISGVPSEDVLRLLNGYLESVGVQDPVQLEDVDDEVFYGEAWDTFLPFPDIIPQLKQRLYEENQGVLYENFARNEEEEN